MASNIKEEKTKHLADLVDVVRNDVKYKKTNDLSVDGVDNDEKRKNETTPDSTVMDEDKAEYLCLKTHLKNTQVQMQDMEALEDIQFQVDWLKMQLKNVQAELLKIKTTNEKSSGDNKQT